MRGDGLEISTLADHLKKIKIILLKKIKRLETKFLFGLFKINSNFLSDQIKIFIKKFMVFNK